LPTPFFIVGNDRSGTTMLRLILDRGPDVAIPPESMYLTDFAHDPPPEMREVWEHPKVRLWELPGPPPDVPAGLSAGERLRFVFEAPFRAYAAKHGKPGWADKTPHYVHHVDELRRVFGEARFVILVRDGRDVALSVKPLPFGPNNAWAAAQWWARGIRAGDAAQRAHPEHVLTVRYEDLTADPAAEVARICAFLGLRNDPDMLAIEHSDRSKIVADQVAWFPNIFEGISTRGVGRWRREMSRRDQLVFARLAGAELQAHGYPVPDVEPPEIPAWRARIFNAHNEFMRDVNFLRLRLVQERGREFRHALMRRARDRRERSRRS
jgi:hypothetical protein